jgi:hypothetical protein
LEGGRWQHDGDWRFQQPQQLFLLLLQQPLRQQPLQRLLQLPLPES